MSMDTEENGNGGADYSDPQAFAEAAKAQTGFDTDNADDSTEKNQDRGGDSAQQAQDSSRNYQEFVDLSGLPEEIRKPVEARFSHLSHLHKKAEKKYEGRLNQYEDLLRQQSEVIAQLQAGFGTVVDEMHSKTFAERETSLETQIEQAFESGDFKAMTKAQNELIELRLERKTAEKQQKQQPKQQQRQPAPNAYQIAQDGVAEGEITEEDADYLETWQSERDANGQLVRAWAHNPDPNNPNPQYMAALREAEAVFNNPNFANASIQQKMAEVDRRMGVKQRAASQPGRSALGGGLTGGNGKATMGLTEIEKQIAIKTKFAGPNAKPEEHLSAYYKQIQSVRKAKRG